MEPNGAELEPSWSFKKLADPTAKPNCGEAQGVLEVAYLWKFMSRDQQWLLVAFDRRPRDVRTTNNSIDTATQLHNIFFSLCDER